MSALEVLRRRYFAERQHTPKTSRFAEHWQRVEGQASYVLGEARELAVAAHHYGNALSAPVALAPAEEARRLRDVRLELADVVIAAATLAADLGVTVEDCIAEKTEADRGRG